jgi:Uri superfamily endonuclease
MRRGLKGGYALVILFGGGRVRYGSREADLVAGPYVYSGSALNGIQGRIDRHQKKFYGIGGKNHWHIDALLAGCSAVAAISARSEERVECRLASALSSLPGMSPVEGFGSTDCRAGCKGHLIRSSLGFEETADMVRGAFRALGLDPIDCSRWERSTEPDQRMAETIQKMRSHPSRAIK